MLAFMAFSIIGPGAMLLLPVAGQAQFVVVTPPWFSAGRSAAVVAAAGGRIVAMGGLPNVIDAYADDWHFVADAYAAGAWLVLDTAILGGCRGTTSVGPYIGFQGQT